MRKMRSHLSCAIMAALTLATVACSASKQSDSKTKAIVGLDASGKDAAFALLVVRNWSPKPLSPKAATDRGVRFAEALIHEPLLAAIECTSGQNAAGQMRSASQWLEDLEALSFSGRLHVNARRQLTASSAEAASIGPAPCRVVGRSFMTYAVAGDLFFRIEHLPRQRPSDRALLAAAETTYVASQALFLAIRGAYDAAGTVADSPLIKSLNAMATSNGVDARAIDWPGLFKTFDPLFNPCLKVQQAPWFVTEWREASFACVLPTNGGGRLNFRAGGASGADYVRIRNLVAGDIALAHKTLFGRKKMNHQDLLWEVLVSTTSWQDAQDGLAPIGNALTGRATPGFDFDAFFSEASPQAKGVGFGLTLETKVTPTLYRNPESGLLEQSPPASPGGSPIQNSAPEAPLNDMFAQSSPADPASDISPPLPTNSVASVDPFDPFGADGSQGFPPNPFDAEFPKNSASGNGIDNPNFASAWNTPMYDPMSGGLGAFYPPQPDYNPQNDFSSDHNAFGLSAH